MSSRVLLLCFVLAGCDEAFDLVHVEPPMGSAADGGVDMSSPDGLIAHWPMDSLIDVVTEDVAGMHDATCQLSVCPTAAAGKVGGALMFDGESQMLDVARSTALVTNDGFTATAWAYLADLQGTQCVMSKRFGPDNDNTWQICVSPSGGIDIFTFTGAPDYLGGGTVTAQAWHHVALSYDRTAVRVYVDGIERASKSMTLVFDEGAMHLAGDRDGGAAAALWHGMLDDLRLYDHALSVSEIELLATP